jgi:hypothetical protein
MPDREETNERASVGDVCRPLIDIKIKTQFLSHGEQNDCLSLAAIGTITPTIPRQLIGPELDIRPFRITLFSVIFGQSVHHWFCCAFELITGRSE